eukprot:50028_1
MAATLEEIVKVELAQLGGAKEPFEIDLCWTVDHLLDRVSTHIGIEKAGMKLLCKGKMLNKKNIADKTLKSLKIKQKDKIIVMNKPVIHKAKPKPKPQPKVNPNSKNSVDHAIERKKNISEIKAAAEKLAQRHNEGYDWNANYYVELTNQYGDKIVLPEPQRQALTVGLTLHEKGKKLIQSKHYSDAIEILKLAFDSLSKVNKEFIQNIDNYGLLALDIVWCYYLNKDESNLSLAAQWLDIAQHGLECAHGKDLKRLKQIRGSDTFIPEFALYVRLNVLRALQSFYCNDLNSAHSHLLRAEMDMRKLQINDLDLVKLQSMGFHHLEARRGLRFSSGNVEQAINYIYNKRQDKEKKEREERKRLEERAIQRKYGHTQNGQFIDLNVMKQLMQMGVEEEIVIEALRQCNNHHQQTLNLCLDPQQKEILSQTLFARHLNDKYLYKIEQILSVLGADHVTESRVRAALFLSYKDVEEAIRILSAPNPNDVVDLDRIEPRFVPYVQRRMMQMIQDNATDNHNDNANTNGDDDLKEDEAQESGDVVEPMQMETKAMPNPTLGDDDNDNQNEDDDADVEMNEPKLVEQFAPIAHKLPNDDDEKIEEHILNDLDNDEDSYLDVDLSNEQDAINNLKVLLNSIQASNPQASLSLFHQ